MTAKVLNLRDGFRGYDEVDLIRIVSEDYNLLILPDYMPVLGEIRGFVEIVSGEEQAVYEGINGFFMHRHNEFELLITEEEYVG
ncbi:MAG: hypothetical protein ACLTKI_00215 [Lachnospiraceae bacterium]